MNVRIRSALPADAAAIAGIYNYDIENTVITFEEELVSTETMATRIADVQRASLPWLVAELDSALLGYAYARASGKCAVPTATRLKPPSTWSKVEKDKVSANVCIQSF